MKFLAPFIVLAFFGMVTVNTIIWYFEDKNYSPAIEEIENYEVKYRDLEEVASFISQNKDRWIKGIRTYEFRFYELAEKWENETGPIKKEKYFKELKEICPMVYGPREEIINFIASRTLKTATEKYRLCPN